MGTDLILIRSVLDIAYIQCLLREKIDLITLDLKMPGLSLKGRVKERQVAE